ncbi:hypothetical protein [Streptomyces sp. YS415]|uniref:hypothetical protein n=1 Tax=Streptomyces sp. YS415 TaxID=2944806 RepID=UPI00202186D0|nr:hypothetical protein [Streptomyces sp. YS415]MCL7425498.1 hypothetical protein [Streptomyces sp. YS415]
MGLWMEWEVSGIAAAGEEVLDTEGAVRALDVSIDRIRERAGLNVAQDRMLLHEAAEARKRLLSEGHTAVHEGRLWSVVVGDVRVSLTPRDHG